MSVTFPTPDLAVATPLIPTVREIRAHFDQRAKSKSTFKGLALFIVSLVPYAAGYAGFFLLPGWPLRILSAAVLTVAIPMLFIVGHDACHQALTPRSWLNKVVGRICFLPSWHAYSVWDYGHNSLHHGWTNVRTRDLVWTPLSAQEYAGLSRLGRLLNRLYRTAWGVGLYYLIEMWIKFGMTQAKVKTAKTNRLFWADRFSVVAFLIVQIAAVLLLTNRAGLGSHSVVVSALLLLIGVIIPFVLWNWLMGFVVFQHHTHPSVPWYGDEQDWTFYAGQVQSVVHVELPRLIELILHNIMEHTAHHVDPRIPLYNLEDCQKKLETAYRADLIVFPFTFGGYFKTLRTCRLFDYENHRWLDWDGAPTTPRLLKREPSQGKLLRRSSAAASDHWADDCGTL
jgi:omega-6 fatty acid desaturase (delta-12 desaturase)